MKDKRKFIAALVTPFVVWIATEWGVEIDATAQAAIVSIVTAGAVYYIPN